MKVENIDSKYSVIQSQRLFFDKGETRSIKSRKQLLKKLKEVVQSEEAAINQALFKDLGKSTSETFLSEVGLVLTEIDYFLRHLTQLAQPKRVMSSLLNWPSRDYIIPEPYGVMLHISPWNYPFQLVFTPLIGAIAAGNTVVVKPSELAPHTADCVENIIKLAFPPEWVTVVQGGPEVGKSLLEERWDFMMYTGGVQVAKIVAAAAAKHLTPTLLELGGKNPCIVDNSAKIKVAARRIVFGKFLNCGQTCIAPDYVLVHTSVKDALVKAIIEAIEKSYGADQSNSEDYGHIINDRHFERLTSLLESQNINYEIGIGTYTSSSNTLSRDTVLQSSNSNAKLNLSGVSFVFCAVPANKTVFINENGVIDLVNTDIKLDGVSIQNLNASGDIGVSGLLTMRRESAGNFFHAFVDDANDKTISLYSDATSSPDWRLGLKNSPISLIKFELSKFWVTKSEN